MAESRADAGRPLIDIRDVRKVYGVQGGEVVALNGITLQIQRGDIYGIIGLSGAGKSTLIRCMNRLDEPTEGEIRIDGRDILMMNKKELRQMRRSVGMIFQQFNLLMQRTVAKNVRYPMEIARTPRARIDERVKELLEIVGLSDKANAYPAQLSGGQKQRVAIARALACDPQVLLCDEATSALDPMTTQSILRLLQDINRTLGITIVVITHEMAVIRQICTRVAILDGGSIAEEGSVDEVFTHTRSAAGRRLFGIPSAEERATPAAPALRVVFGGELVDDPIIARLVLHLGQPISILAADVRELNGAQYGQMIIRRPDDDALCAKAIKYLRDTGLTVEEVPGQ
ncbi:MAG: ATP-binding cassette domain-containing protein [Clostridiales bacterium]|nr:ATP-binding cassette domain-containing protein [Clostridiales bacterium]